MNNWVCQKCNTLNTDNYCLNCSAAANAQAASGLTRQFQAQNQTQFPPQQSFQPPPQYAQPQMPPDLPQKSGGTHNLLLGGFVVAVFALAISGLIWGVVFGAPGANKVLPIVLLSAGLLMTGINAALVIRKIRKIKKSTKTTGVVMNVEVSQGMQQLDYSSTRNTLFTPTVRFQTADGRIIDYKPEMSSSWSNRRIGENVPVYYDPQQPEKPIVGKPYNLWFPHLLFGIVGGMFLFIGTLFLLMSSKFPQIPQ